MNIKYTLTPELRKKLKEPLGVLIRGSYAETMNALKEFMAKEKPAIIISVGDIVSKNLAKNHFTPKLAIVDNKAMRRRIPPIPLPAEKIVYIRNPPGTITEEAENTIRNAIQHNSRVKIVVDGEEDLLTLITVLYSPENSLVIYGQPREGIVIIKVTPEKKAEVAEILGIMKNVRKAK